MIHLENYWKNLDEIWHERYAIGVYPKIVISSFLPSVKANMGEKRTRYI
jgi:hypothetical protein